MTDCDVCNSGPADHFITLHESAATIEPGDVQRLAVLEELHVCADCWAGIRILYVPPTGLTPRLDLPTIHQFLDFLIPHRVILHPMIINHVRIMRCVATTILSSETYARLSKALLPESV